MTGDQLRFGLLGPLEVSVAGRPIAVVGTRPKALLAILLAHANRVVPADRLIDDLWSGSPTPGATATLQGYVSEVRKALADATGERAPILTRRPGYLIQLTDDQLDLLRFDRLLAEARAGAGSGGEPVGARLRQALDLWRGPALADFVDEPFARPIAARYDEARLWALQERVEIDLQSGRHAELVTELDQLTVEHPLCERLWGQRMLALYRSGRQAEALRAYQELRSRLDTELGIGPSPALQRLENAVLLQDPSLEPAVVAQPTRPVVPDPADDLPGEHSHSPPAQVTRFVGRKRELPVVRQLLADTRLLTLTGSGGCGKTRMAAHLAAEASPSFESGVRFVDLSALCDPAEVDRAVGTAFGLLGTGDAEALCERLGDAQVLLILDNCEHVIDASAGLVEALLARCPRVTVLVTSQEALRVAGETVFRVPSLGVPDPTQPAGADVILGSEAVQLFVERASSALPELKPDEAALADIAYICRRLDGIPLAIELAAALVAILPVSDIVRRLDDRFSLLTQGRRRSVARQRTLRAAIDWSYDLLAEPERTLFAQLSVFVGPFSLEAAEATAGGDGRFLATFSALISKSMVVALAGPAGTARYRLLETLRHYGLERLGESGEEGEARQRHAAHYTSFAEAADRRLHGSDPADWSSHVVRELPNLRAALDWSFSNGDLELGVRLAGALRWWFFGRMGQLDQAREWLESAIKRRDELPAPLLLKSLTAAMTVAFLQGDYRRTSHIGEEAVALAEKLDDRAELAVALMARGGAAVYEGNPARAVECLGRSLGHCQELGDRWGRAWVLTFWGVQARRSGDDAAARAQLSEALSTFRDLHDDHNQVIPLIQLALVAQHAGDVEEAVRRCQEAILLARRLGDRLLVHSATCIYGRVELARGRLDEARRLLIASLGSFRGAEHHLTVALAVEGLACIAHADNRDRAAAELWGFAGQVRAASASPLTRERADERDDHLRRARQRVDPEVVDEGLAAGAVLSFEQVLVLVETD